MKQQTIVKTSDFFPKQNVSTATKLASVGTLAAPPAPDAPDASTPVALDTSKNANTELITPTALPEASPAPVSLFTLDKAKPLEPGSFPNPPRSGNLVPPTITNIEHLLKAYGISVRYDIIKKKLRVNVPGSSGTPDNFDNVAMSQIISLAVLNGMPTGLLPSSVDAIGDRYQVNPVADWITLQPWDGVDRLQSLCDTLVQRADFPEQLKRTLMHRWLLSTVAAALTSCGFRSRGVLTLQGPQSIGKTAWVSALIPDIALREGLIKLDHHLDASNKDSLLTGITHWIVEIGELDSSFKKDIARLKGFLTSDRDKIRRPYARADSEYPRRTVFCATVNDNNFLVDATGNSRWWSIPVTGINYRHGINMQQLFAQMAVDFQKGEPWWLTQAEEASLELHNKSHRTISAMRERVLDAIDVDRADRSNLPAMTATDLLREIGIDNPTNPQCKECAAVLREFFGDPKRINGRDKWRVPMRTNSTSFSPARPVRDESEF